MPAAVLEFKALKDDAAQVWIVSEFAAAGKRITPQACTIFNTLAPRRGPLNLPVLGVSVAGGTWVLCDPRQVKPFVDERDVVAGVVGEVAAKIRAVRPPEPYKGTGIAYQGEVIRHKAGKAGKAAGSK